MTTYAALRDVLDSTIASIKREAATRALWAVAESIAAFASGDYAGASIKSDEAFVWSGGDIGRRRWERRILASIPAPQRVTAAALRARGVAEGWLR